MLQHECIQSLESYEFSAIVSDMTRNELEIAYIELIQFYVQYKTIGCNILCVQIEDLSLHAILACSKSKSIMMSEFELISEAHFVFKEIKKIQKNFLLT
jgi:hypothetical protein